MTYKEFVDWFVSGSRDGKLTTERNIYCSILMHELIILPFDEREKAWSDKVATDENLQVIISDILKENSNDGT